MPAPEKLEQATVVCKANVYFDGKVVSHTVLQAGGAKSSVGLIFPNPGATPFKFNTDGPERMEITAGTCRVRLSGESAWRTYRQGEGFRVDGKSSFEIAAEGGIAEYLCVFE